MPNDPTRPLDRNDPKIRFGSLSARRSPEEGLSAARFDRPALRAVGWGLLIFAVVVFAWRGIWPGLNDSPDLAVGYAGGRAWLAGHDPYDAATLNADILLAGGAEVVADRVLDRLPNVYFPTTIPAFAPLALTPWPVAKLLWLGLNSAAALFIATGSARLLGWPLRALRSRTLVAFILVLAPFHTTVALGQTGLVSTAAVVAALLLERSGRRIPAGIAFGLATILKIQIGLPFLAYLIWRRRWLSVVTAALLVIGSSLLAVVRMHIAGVPWGSSWLTNLTVASSPGGLNDSSPANPERYSLINLQYPLSILVPGPVWANLAAIVLVGLAAAILLWIARRYRPGEELLVVSIVAVLGLLVTYHRYYDAVVLALPIAWAFSMVGTTRWRQAALVILLCTDFIFPVLGAMRLADERQMLPLGLTDSLIWRVVLLPIHVWVLVSLVAVLLWSLARAPRHQVGADTSLSSGRPSSSAWLGAAVVLEATHASTELMIRPILECSCI